MSRSAGHTMSAVSTPADIARVASSSAGGPARPLTVALAGTGEHGAMPLDDRRSLLRALGHWVWATHAGRQMPARLYAFELLVRQTTDTSSNHNNIWSFHVPDHVPWRPTALPAARRQLRELARSLAYVALTAADVLRFVSGYLAEVSLTREEQHQLLRQEFPWLERWIFLLRRRRWSPLVWPADLPMPGPQPPVIEQPRPEVIVRRHPDVVTAFDFAAWQWPTRDSPGRLDKPGLGDARVRQRLQLLVTRTDREPQTETVFAKWYAKDGRRAEHEFDELSHLICSSVPTALPLAVAVERGATGQGWWRLLLGRQRCRGLLLTAGVPGVPLDRWLNDMSLRSADPAARRHRSFLGIEARVRFRLARSVGRLVGHLHAAGVFHRDLYLCHVFISEHVMSPGDRPQFALRLIDLARAIVRPLRRRRWAVKDLAALYFSSRAIPGVTNTDRLRALHAYMLACDESDLSDASLRRWIEAVVGKATRIARHDARRHARRRRTSKS